MTAQNINVPPLWIEFKNQFWARNIKLFAEEHLNGVVFEELVSHRKTKSLFEDFSWFLGIDETRQTPEQHLEATYDT